MAAQRQAGFTLIELVIVIVISGALSIVVMQFITAPIDVYVDQSRRARLVESAQSVMQRLAYDVRMAVPNSIRVGCGGGSALHQVLRCSATVRQQSMLS